MAPRTWSSVLAFSRSLLVLMLLAGCSGGDSGRGAGSPAPPIANAGQDQKIAVRVPVTLDGSASEAPSGEPVSYQWTLTAKPAGSIASLANPTSVRPTFTPDVSGSYSATLVVRSNGVQSQPDTVDFTCNTGDLAPFAYAGPDRSTTPGETIILDGTPSKDPNNMPLTYSWRLVNQPQGSNPVLSNAPTA